jgi:predicted DNA-binding transcriptional regulator YafY
MRRNAEVNRQWEIVRTLEASRHGQTVAELAARTGVSRRTVWRDLIALQEAGFPIADESARGGARWRLDGRPFRPALERGLSLTQLCALYFSRSLLEGVAGALFDDELRTTLDQLQFALPLRLRRFLDQLPGVFQSRLPPGRRRSRADQGVLIARLLDAVLHCRRAQMQYYSGAGDRVTACAIDPLRLVYAHGSLYLFAHVREHDEVRAFAIERIQQLEVLDQTFTPVASVAGDPFADTIGVRGGTALQVVLEFSPRVGAYVAERTWHVSQAIRRLADGGVRMTLAVGDDRALRSWILGFGADVRVVAPRSLADGIREELDEARSQYRGTGVVLDFDAQPLLPFLDEGRRRAS